MTNLSGTVVGQIKMIDTYNKYTCMCVIFSLLLKTLLVA